MNALRRFLIRLTAAGNVVAALMLLGCGLSSRLNPAEYPFAAVLGLCFPLVLALNAAFLVVWIVFCVRYVWLPVVGMAVSWSYIFSYCPLNLSKDVPEGAIKLLTYNVRSLDAEGVNAEGLSLWEYLAGSEADIVCLQECGTRKAAEFDSLMSAMGYPCIVKPKNKQSLAVYSRFPLVSVRTVAYESTSNGSLAAEVLYEGDTVLVVNNHLESYKLSVDDKEKYRGIIKEPEGEGTEDAARTIVQKISEASRIRGPQADSVLCFAEGTGREAMIICGDFNESPISYTCHRMGEKLTSAYRQSGRGFGFSYNEKGFYFRIDHVFISDYWRSYGTYIDKTAPWSDHYPLITYLQKAKN